MPGILKKIYDKVAPPSNKTSDGRDAWGSRFSFILASMGGAVGFGSLLRFPSIVFNNYGLQFFIPYLMSLFLLAIPTLMLEIAVGQAFRAGCIVAWNTANKRAKGVGLGVIWNGYAITLYFVPMIAWMMKYFRYSFQNPLPWEGNSQEFYNTHILEVVPAIPGELSEDNSRVLSYHSYPGTAMIGETAGWTIFTWFVMWLCVFRGVGLTGRVIYFTLGIPLVLIVILIGRSAALPNAVDGVKLYFGTWDSAKLATPELWQEACGQIFFSAGIGMGYYTSYASYNAKWSNAIQDAVIIGVSNMCIEVLAAFAVFSIIGYMGMDPDSGPPLDSFTAAFITYPEALAQMPGQNFWAIIFFATLFLLGMSSAFAMLEGLITGVMDTDWGKRYPRPLVVTIIIAASALMSLPFATEFGYDLLGAADTWVNYFSLFFIVWAEAVCATTLYRYKDVVDQCGMVSFALYNVGYFGGQVGGFAAGHAVSPAVGAGVGFGIFVLGLVSSLLMSTDPTANTPGFWRRSAMLRKFWWLAFYSGNQLRRDLNAVIGTGDNWEVPAVFGAVLRYITAPIIGMLFSMSYPRFYLNNRMDPLHIISFACYHIVILISLTGFFIPRWFNVFVPRDRINDGAYPVNPGVIQKRANAENEFTGEEIQGSPRGSSSNDLEKNDIRDVSEKSNASSASADDVPNRA